MSNTISLIFVGRLGADPQMKYLQSGTPVATFNVAVDDSYKTSEGEKVERTIWLRCTAWNKLAELAHQYLYKGALVWIEGTPSASGYIGKDGKPTATLEVRVNNMRFLSPSRRSEAETGEEDGDDAQMSVIPF